MMFSSEKLRHTSERFCQTNMLVWQEFQVLEDEAYLFAKSVKTWSLLS